MEHHESRDQQGQNAVAGQEQQGSAGGHLLGLGSGRADALRGGRHPVSAGQPAGGDARVERGDGDLRAREAGALADAGDVAEEEGAMKAGQPGCEAPKFKPGDRVRVRAVGYKQDGQEYSVVQAPDKNGFCSIKTLDGHWTCSIPASHLELVAPDLLTWAIEQSGAAIAAETEAMHLRQHLRHVIAALDSIEDQLIVPAGLRGIILSDESVAWFTPLIQAARIAAQPKAWGES